MIKWILILSVLVLSSCNLKIAIKEEKIPDFKETYLIAIDPDESAEIQFTGEVEVTASHTVVDFVKNKKGLVVDFIPNVKTESFLLDENAIKTAQQKLDEELADGQEMELVNVEEEDPFRKRCVAYDRWIKSRVIENQREVPYAECVQAIRKLRTNYVVFWVYLREFFLGLIQEKFHSLTRG